MFIKFIRIFLLVLIILGILALATQKTWVPKLVGKIIEKENKATMANISGIIQGRQCFQYIHNATDTEPYEVSENLELNFTPEGVSGIKNGTQKGPDMTNGYSGLFIGKLDIDMLSGTFFYVIEGASQKEQEIYQVKSNHLEKLRYMLKEEDGTLVPDTTTIPKILIYSHIECPASK